MDLKSYLAAQQRLVNKTLSSFLDQYPRSRLVAAMGHSLLNGGKRLRPILCLASCHAVGGAIEKVVDAACALELIHTYSLIHDDLPAMDNDVVRRGKPTCHVAFDEATAILAGDALLTMAFEILAAGALADAARIRLWVESIGIIARAAGCSGMVEGQARDIHSQNQRLGLEALEQMHHLKTGALIQAAVEVGAVLGEGRPWQTQSLKAYARHVGLAFQVADDLLDVEGDAKLMGKSTGSDKKLNKNTYPSVMGAAQSRQLARRLVQMALQALEDFDNRADPLRAIAAYTVERNQ
jgi:geranylgeranyl diphosphate synthase type II